MKEYLFKVSDDDEGERIDKYLTLLCPDLTRTYIQKQIEDGLLKVNNEAKKSNYRIKSDDSVVFCVPDAVSPEIKAQDIPIEFVYEDDDVAIVNKPQGMVVHPSAGHYDDTLVNGLLYHMKGRLSGINGVLRPGIVHRIDKDTSGLLIICKSDFSHNFIAEQLKEHSVNRIYHAIVHGYVKEEEGTVDAPLGRSPKDRKKMAIVPDGKRAVTHYKVLEHFKNYTYIECRLETGRTHQIRVHMASLNHPLMGDTIYGPEKEPVSCKGQQLHAKTIGLISPTTKEKLFFDSSLPDYFEKTLSYLRNSNK